MEPIDQTTNEFDPNPATAAPRKQRTRVIPPVASAAAVGTTVAGTTTEPSTEGAKAQFGKALDEARAGAQILSTQAQDKVREKFAGPKSEWVDEAKVMGDQAKEKAALFANEGKVRASEAISGLGKIVADNAGTIDEKLGAKYGDYARSAARTMQDTADKIEAKDLGELGDDAKAFVRKSPGLAVGIAAAAGFVLASFFRKGNN